jgi:hypothetical protein
MWHVHTAQIPLFLRGPPHYLHGRTQNYSKKTGCAQKYALKLGPQTDATALEGIDLGHKLDLMVSFLDI